jgi:hypothetical protein
VLAVVGKLSFSALPPTALCLILKDVLYMFSCFNESLFGWAKYFDMKPESRNSPLLGNASLSMFP